MDSLLLQAHAATITVDTADDELNSDGDCSLREAIQAANTDTAVDGCAAGSGADEIVLGSLAVTLTLEGADEDDNATGDLDIKSDLTIEGNDALVDGNGTDRVFDIAASTTVTLTGIKVQNGRVEPAHGGGIRNAGTLTLDGVNLVNSTAKGDDGGGSGGGFGGGVYNTGTSPRATAPSRGTSCWVETAVRESPRVAAAAPGSGRASSTRAGP